MNQYNHFKAVHHPAIISDLRANLTTTPIHVQLVLTNRCNHRCLYCAYRLDGFTTNQNFNSVDEWDSDEAIDLLKQLYQRGVKAIQFTGGGEPLIHPYIEEILLFAIKNFDTALVTNGVFLNNKLIDLVSEMTWVRFSIDAATNDIYQLLRRSRDNISAIFKNTELLKKRNKSIVVGHSFVINKNNMSDIYQAAVNAKNCGADNIRFSAVFTPEKSKHFPEGSQTFIRKQLEKTNKLSDSNFKIINNFNLRFDDLKNKIDYSECFYNRFVTYIGADKKFYTCCCKAYSDSGFLFDYSRNKDIYFLFDSVKEKLKQDPQSYCDNPCMFNGHNKFYNYLFSRNPLHVNFV